ncbi:hypothetical protein ACVNPS_05955 [Candidatus Bipolaricaulota sp. J31]
MAESLALAEALWQEASHRAGGTRGSRDRAGIRCSGRHRLAWALLWPLLFMRRAR